MTSLPDRPRPRLSRKQLRERLRTLRRQQARKARAARRQLERIHQQLPKVVRAAFDPLEPAFTRPTYHRFLLLALAAILTLGGRTVANLLRTLGAMAPGGTPPATTASSPGIAGPPGPWRAGSHTRSSPDSRPKAPSRWPATTP